MFSILIHYVSFAISYFSCDCKVSFQQAFSSLYYMILQKSF